MVKDRQNEERQRKLEELKNQAIAAQKYREQKEEERKRRMEELKHKEMDRKQQVGIFGRRGGSSKTTMFRFGVLKKNELLGRRTKEGDNGC